MLHIRWIEISYNDNQLTVWVNLSTRFIGNNDEKVINLAQKILTRHETFVRDSFVANIMLVNPNLCEYRLWDALWSKGLDVVPGVKLQYVEVLHTAYDCSGLDGRLSLLIYDERDHNSIQFIPFGIFYPEIWYLRPKILFSST